MEITIAEMVASEYVPGNVILRLREGMSEEETDGFFSAHGFDSEEVEQLDPYLRIFLVHFEVSGSEAADVLTASLLNEFRQDDGGNAWVEQVSDYHEGLTSVSAADPHNAWAVGRNGTILHTAGGGRFTFYFAEGYTGPGFEEWICVLNPEDAPKGLTFRFQTEEEGEKVVGGQSVPAHSRAAFPRTSSWVRDTSFRVRCTGYPAAASRPRGPCTSFATAGTGGTT